MSRGYTGDMEILITVDPTHSVSSCVDAVAAQLWTDDVEYRLISAVHSGLLDDGSTVAAASENLAILKEELSKRVVGPVVGAQVDEGNAADVVLRAADRFVSSLIVVGSRPKTAVQRLFLGSVSQTVLEKAHCPVLVVRNFKGDHAHTFKRIVVAVDGSPYTNLALEWLSYHRWLPGTEIVFVTVLSPISANIETTNIEEAMCELAVHGDDESKAIGHIDGLVSTFWPALSKEYYSVEVLSGDAATEIMEFAHRTDADLIVMGSHGRTGLKRLLLGSVSQTVANSAPCSVLVVKPTIVGRAAYREQTSSRQYDDMPHVMPSAMG